MLKNGIVPFSGIHCRSIRFFFAFAVIVNLITNQVLSKNLTRNSEIMRSAKGEMSIWGSLLRSREVSRASSDASSLQLNDADSGSTKPDADASTRTDITAEFLAAAMAKIKQSGTTRSMKLRAKRKGHLRNILDSHNSSETADRIFRRKRKADNQWRKKLFRSTSITEALRRDPHMKSNATELALWGKEFLRNMTDLIKTNRRNQTLLKAALSNTTRALVLAGLEGTGHHAWQSMVESCLSSSKCQPDHLLNLILMDEFGTFIRGLFAVNDYHLMIRDCKFALDRLQAIAAAGNTSLYLLGMDQTVRVGHLSYPSFSGEFKILDRPDMFLLGSLAELAGLDLRIVVLQRSAKDIIASTERRGYSSAAYLLDNAAALYQQLSMLHPDFFYCVDYDSMTTMTPEDRQHLLDFIHPVQLAGMGEKMFSHVKPHLHTNSSPASSRNGSGGLTEVTLSYYAHRLQAILFMINSLCEQRTLRTSIPASTFRAESNSASWVAGMTTAG